MTAMVTPGSAKPGPRAAAKEKTRVRDAEATQKRILAAAKKEFARNGLAGARVDRIARQAQANKRMIYHYFESKEKLFTRVLEEGYADIRAAERKLDLHALAPEDAIATLVRFTWNYYLANPEFLTLVNSANLHRARHLKASQRIHEVSRPFVGMVQDILERGVAAGVFRPGIDPVQLNITIAAIGYYYLTNRWTGSIIFERELMAADALEARLAFNIETILRLLRA